MKNGVFLGLDGGGTHTRTAITDINGNLLSHVKWDKPTNINYDENAKENVFDAVNTAAKMANCALSDIIGFTAGVGGYDSEEDLEWVCKITDIEGLTCSVQSVNDSVVAQQGAFLLQPGIIAISGTGSIIFGINESQKHIRNYDFHNYSGAAQELAYDSVHKMIARETDETDKEFVNALMEYFKVSDLTGLTELGAKGFVEEYTERAKLLGDFAPVVTAFALGGSNLAQSLCNELAGDLVTGIKIVGACFESASVPVSLIGSVANSIFIKNKIMESLSKKDSNKRYVLAEPALPPVLGAILMAMKSNGISINGRIINNLRESASQLQAK